jgi:6,7-dimethyl-8-ribityllumazine synthase
MSWKEYSGNLDAKGLKIGIVISRHNDFLTKQLLQGAIDCLIRHGVDEKDVAVVWVPGAYETPVVAKKLAQSGKFSALVALGAVIQGATPHAGLINNQLTRALTQISLDNDVAVIDGVVAADNLEQAIERCGTKGGNRGWNAAQAAIEMANLLKNLKV